MHKRFTKDILCAALALIMALSAALPAFAVGAGERVYVNNSALADGLDYTSTVSYKTGLREESFVLSASPDGDVRPVVLACDTIYGGMTVSDAVSYAEGLGWNVLAAVNSDFFTVSNHVPNGLVIEDGIYKSSARQSPAVCFDGNGDAFLVENGAVDVSISTAGGDVVSLTSFNKARGDDGLYLFSEHFSTVSTRTSGEGWFVTFQILDGVMTVNGELELEVVSVSVDGGAVPIGEDRLVLTAAAAAGQDAVASAFAAGDHVTLTTACADERLGSAAWATGCGDVLVRDGEITDQTKWDAAVASANPRTAVGVTADGRLLVYSVDGRSKKYSNGLTLKELAEELLAQDCVWGVNMDGGGSVSVQLRVPGTDTYSTVNSPSDGAERRCSTFIMFVTDAASGGTARLYLKQDGAYVLSGSTIELGVTAADSSYRAEAVPPGVSAVSSDGLGKLTGLLYTAGDKSGTDTVLLSSDEAAGAGSMHVITAVDTLTVTDSANGKSVSELELDKGERVTLLAAASLYGREVLTDSSAFSWTVSGGVGAIGEDGTFTAVDRYGAAGVITLYCGGQELSIPVEIPMPADDIAGHWAEGHICELYDMAVVTGTGDGYFRPDAQMTRADFLLMLWRAAGCPAPKDGSGFEDVAADSYYADAVAWAEEQGIARGDGVAFRPAATLTREEAFTLIYRSLGILGVSFREGGAAQLAGFTDAGDVAEWAVVPSGTLVGLGVVSGSGGALDPQGELTRAQMAKLLCTALRD